MNMLATAEHIALQDLDYEINLRLAEDSLYEFVKQAWHVVEPGVPFVPNWHIEAICDHLEAVSAGEIHRLLINIPPRHAKSTIVSVMWPAWEWIRAPHEKFLCASYSGILSTRDNVKCRRLIASPWYQERWGGVVILSGDQNQKTRFENTATGYRIATSVGGTATGEGGTRLVLDDPHGAQDAQSEAMRETAIEWFDQVWSTRLNDPKNSAMVTIMQRLHEKDVSGRIMELGGWEHVCMPAEWDGVKRVSMLGAYDPRTTRGSLLWPERFGPPELAKLKLLLGDYGTAGQLQQQPAPSGGGIINTEKFQLWPHTSPLPQIMYVVQCYDTAFTEKTQNDPTACTVWGIFEHRGRRRAMLLDAWDERMKYPQLRQKVIDDWNVQYGKSDGVGVKPIKADLALIENKGSGQALINDLGQAKVMARSFDLPRGDSGRELSKVARAHIITPIVDAGDIYVLESSKEPGKPIMWARPWINECKLFPKGEHDDLVDTFTMGMYFLKQSDWFELPEAAQDEPDEYDYAAARKRAVNPYAS